MRYTPLLNEDILQLLQEDWIGKVINGGCVALSLCYSTDGSLQSYLAACRMLLSYEETVHGGSDWSEEHGGVCYNAHSLMVANEDGMSERYWVSEQGARAPTVADVARHELQDISRAVLLISDHAMAWIDGMVIDNGARDRPGACRLEGWIQHDGKWLDFWKRDLTVCSYKPSDTAHNRVFL